MFPAVSPSVTEGRSSCVQHFIPPDRSVRELVLSMTTYASDVAARQAHDGLLPEEGADAGLTSVSGLGSAAFFHHSDAVGGGELVLAVVEGPVQFTLRATDSEHPICTQAQLEALARQLLARIASARAGQGPSSATPPAPPPV